jgi:hypothetical protein
MSPAAENVIERLDAARQKWWLFTLLTTAVLAFCLSFGLLQAFMFLDALVRLSQLWLAVLCALWLGVTLGLMALVGHRLARSQRSLEATARRVEWEFPELGNDLINVVQLAGTTPTGDRAFCEAAVNHAAARIGRFRFDSAALREPRWRRFRHCMQTPRDLAESMVLLLTLVGLALLGQAMFPNWASAAGRLLKPWTYVPSVGTVRIVSVKPGDTEILVDTSLEITAEIENPEGKSYEGTLFVAPEGEPETAIAMSLDENATHYKASLPSVLKPLVYRVEIGDSQSQKYTVKVREKPTIAEVGVTLQYPEYLGRPAESFTQRDPDLEAPQYTVAELRIRPSAEIASGQIIADGRAFPGRVEENGGLLVAKLPLLRDSTFTVQMANSAGHSDPNPRVNRIHVVPDKPPTADLRKPGPQETAAPGASIPVVIAASDDYGLGRVRLEMKIKAGAPEESASKKEMAGKKEGAKAKPAEADEAAIAIVQEWTKFEASTNVSLSHRLEVPADKVKPGQSVMLRAVAVDKRAYRDWGLNLKPQETASGWHVVRILAPEVKSAAALQDIENLRSAIWRILEKQVRARVAAATIVPNKDLVQRTAISGQVRSQQVEIQKEAVAVVQAVKDADKEDRQAIKRVINQLANGEMLQAVQHCDELARQKTLEGFDQPAPKLVASQDRIIDVLRKVLEAARQAQADVVAEMAKRPGGDLPDDTKKKLEEAKKKLEEFLKQQKKVIEASENLAKKPVEDFSEEDKQLLKTLAATEDDWSKFLQDLHSDLSKLPEQDFANASIAKELVEIQTEIKMAEDALTKKSADIAVPLEQLGYERAEELVTNFEKWLTDTPDREKWSQEESLSDADKEAPMAELPGELEDIIGDLMEEEEDLFDEMEDVTSSAADSLDKGAGWDAMDGPISNMSAKGVTGNRLPNTSEIGGRAGEGRQGKSSGEFVGDEAVGKGGRKTPSRLTPDPIMKGQIKDHSKEPTGGATGGGKESGQGGEGLEGPTPGSPGKRDYQRLAGKQAALRNKAEAIDTQFQVSNFHHTDLKKMVEMMKQVEADLKAGNYQNALRQRQVLAEKIGNVKQYLEGEFQIRKDTTSNLPGEIQKEMIGGMRDPSPAGWEELNRQYFERLSRTGGSAPAAPAAAPKAEPAQK